MATKVKLKQSRECAAVKLYRALCDATYGYKVNHANLAQLYQWCLRAHTAGVRECNEPGYNAGPAREQVEAWADAMNLDTDWPGLWPEFRVRRNGDVIRLPG